jgi:N-sulfoglucosamine sulfohydrolase
VAPATAAGVVVPPYLPQNSEARTEMAALQGAIRAVEQAMGRVLDALERAALAQQALVIFSADHALAMPRATCTLYDPGISLALLVRWPDGGVRAGTVIPELVSHLDLLPTIPEAAGLPLSAEQQAPPS